MTIQEFEEVCKSIEVGGCEDDGSLGVMIKGRFIDRDGREHGYFRNCPFVKCPIKGKKGKKAWVQMFYEGPKVYDARFGGVRVVQR